MTTTPDALPTVRLVLSEAALAAEAISRFGAYAALWRFRCPRCGRTQSAAELPPERRLHVAQACFACGLLAEEASGDVHAALWWVVLPGGDRTDSFPLADDLDSDIGRAPSQEPQGAAQASAVPVDQTGTEPTPGAPVAPVPTPSSEFLAGPATRWMEMDNAPEDGTEIIGLINGDEVPIRWNDEDRHCAGTGVALGAGYGFGPGWEDTWNNYAVVDEVEGWRPVEPSAKSGA